MASWSELNASKPPLLSNKSTPPPYTICRQIGISPIEDPKLVTTRKEMRALLESRNQDSTRIGGWEECVYAIRTIS
ncbi:MAG: hypothetical protein ACM3X1_07850 [Ignavibacteriales bacterium]